MATQLKLTDFAYTPAQTPRPNIRVAFIAGEATTAIHDAMAKLPADTRNSTLDDLVPNQGVADPTDVQLIQSMTCTLIETARELLSPAMYTAFLRWGETASHASSFYEDDEEGNARCIATADVRSLVSSIETENVHDLLFMMLLSCIESADAPSFGPFDRKYGEFDVNGGDLLAGLSKELRKFSPIPNLFNELSSRAWEVSKCRQAISADIGRAITSAFSFARGEDFPATGINDNGSAADQLQRDWGSAYAAFQAADAAMNAYDCDHMTPLAGDYPDSMDEHYDSLVDVCYEARVNLYLTPAPSASELAIKLDMFASHDDKALVRADEIINSLAADDRRLGGSVAVPGAEWTMRLKAYDAVRSALEAKGLDDDTVDLLADRETAAAKALFAIPAENVGQVTTKLRVLANLNHMIAAEDMKPILAELDGFSGAGGEASRQHEPLSADAPLLAAFATRRHEFEAADKGPWTAEQEDAYFARVDAAEMVLLANPATTIEGVIAKLRVAFMNQDGGDWSDLAISNTADPKFVEGLRMSGMYERMAWSAIEELARIGGVSLPEQGA
jgi:hypothetical protein